MAVRVKAQVLLSCPDLFSFWGGELGLVVVFPVSGALGKHRMKEQECFWVLTQFPGCLSA